MELDWSGEGGSLRANLEEIERQTGVRDERLDTVEVPPGCALIWRDFWELDARRGSNGFGPLPLTHREIKAWRENYGISLSPWEIDAICAMDNARLEATASMTERD